MKLKETIKETVNTVARTTKKHSPEILLGIGVVGIVGGTVLACRATLKLDGILDEQKERLNKINDILEHPEKIADDASYTEEDAKRDKTIVTVQTVGRLAKAYLPAVVIEVAGVVCVCGAFGLVKKELGATAALLSATETAFSEYRERTKAMVGEEKEMDIFLGRQTEVVDTVNEDGAKKKKEKKTTINANNPYTFIFDSDHFRTAKDNASDNMTFLMMQQNALSKLLESRAMRSKKGRAVIYLDEILDNLGYIWGSEDGDDLRYKKESYAHLAGCVYDKNDPNADNCVDLGLASHDILEGSGYDNEAFIRGIEPVAILNINCCGNVWKQWADGKI